MCLVMKLLFLKCSKRRLSLYSLIVLCLCATLNMWIIHRILQFLNDMMAFISVAEHNLQTTLPHNGTKYILSWNPYYLIFPTGKSIFPGLNCPVRNCEFTENRYYLDGDYRKFDVILFNELDLTLKDRPKRRSTSQLYVFTTIESSYNKPACELFTDSFFNWTFTYRLDSTIPWPYFGVRNATGHIVAPSMNVEWQESLRPLRSAVSHILARKTRTAAWLVSNCKADSFRDQYLTMLQEHLFHFALSIDVYGKCTQKKCDNDNCEEMIKNHYFFYMAFENSMSEDYVTEKVLHGYNNFAVPVVYGGANYSRFLPPGSYINAREMHPYNLAFIISEAVKNLDLIKAYFTWTNSYSVVSDWNPVGSAPHPLCDLCAALHEAREPEPAIKNFRVWWNGLNGMKWCLSEEYWNETAQVNLDISHIMTLY